MPDPLTPSQAGRLAYHRFEQWFAAHHARTTWNDLVRQTPAPRWAHALLLEQRLDPQDDPSSQDLHNGGLVVVVSPDPQDRHGRCSGWWAAGAPNTLLTPEAWDAWGIEGVHRFALPLSWFLRATDEVPESLLAVAALAPAEAWVRARTTTATWQVVREAPRAPLWGERLGPLELAALVERWDLVERWARSSPELLPGAEAALLDLGVRPWLQGHGWAHPTKASPDQGGAAGAARIARAWETVALRLMTDASLPVPTPGRTRPRL